jgi:hypothetical protein
MKKLLTVGVLMLGVVSALAWFAPPPGGGDTYLAITRITTSETRTQDFLPAADGGWDLGDTDSAITDSFGGQPFSCGSPVQVEVYVTAPPAGDTWDTISLQYIEGTDSGAGAWTTIRTITSGFASITKASRTQQPLPIL